MAKLTEKQQRFVNEYLIDLNATQAAIRAGYSVESARDIGCENLTKPNIQNEISKAMAERSKRTGITQDRVLQELARIAFLNPNNLIDFKSAEVKEEADENDLACIHSVKVKTSDGAKGFTQEREVRMCDKIRALELIGKHLGMFKEQVEISGLDGEKNKLDDLINQMRGDDSG